MLSQNGARRRFGLTAALAGLVCLAAGGVLADPPRGVFHGQVTDLAGKPVSGATVALQDRHDKVVAWTKTDAQGHYAISAESDTLALLDLGAGHHRGLLASLGRGVVEVVTLPVKAVGAVADVAGDAVESVNPAATAKSAVVSVATASPAPLAAETAQEVGSAVTGQAQRQARERAAKDAVGERPSGKNKKKDDKPRAPQPGEAALLVSAPDDKEFQGPVGAYWVATPDSAGGASAPAAWLDTVRLAPASDKKPSDVQDMAVHLVEPSLTPALAPAGSALHIRVKVQPSPDPGMPLRVVAREERTGHVVALTAQDKGVYAGDLTLDPKTPTGADRVTVAALHASPLGVDLAPAKAGAADPLLDYAAHLDALGPGRPYRFDPRVTASENRLDFTVTVLDPTKETPPAPAPPTPAPQAAAPATPPAASPAAPATPPAAPPKPH